MCPGRLLRAPPATDVADLLGASGLGVMIFVGVGLDYMCWLTGFPEDSLAGAIGDGRVPAPDLMGYNRLLVWRTEETLSLIHI